MVAPALAEVLRNGRGAFNARFTAARRRWPHLDGADFGLFLRDQASPLIDAIAAQSHAHTAAVTNVVYDLGLQLVAEKLAGPAAAERSINRVWENVFPTLAPLVAASPRRVLASLCNATHRLVATPQTDRDGWINDLLTLGPRCADADQLLALGRLLAWRSGLATHRRAALDGANSLPAALALAALRAPAGSDWTSVAASCERNPWFGFGADGRTRVPAESVRRVGTFRGFGGLFATPPTVATDQGHLVVSCGDEAWLLIADVHGAMFQRTASTTPPALTARRELAPLAATLAPGHELTGATLCGNTFAFTTAQSHAVWVGPWRHA